MENYFFGVEDQEVLDSDPYDTFTDLMANLLPEDTIEFPIRVWTYKPRTAIVDEDRILRDLPEREDELIDVNESGILDNVLERLDEEYGDPEGKETLATQKMRESVKVFAEVVRSKAVSTQKMRESVKVFAEVVKGEYTSYWCEKTEEYVDLDKNGNVIKKGKEN